MVTRPSRAALSTSVMTMEDALAYGQGIERPFRCTEHDDSMASASVNVLKGVWFCHACQANGNVDNKKAPKLEELKAMMDPDEDCRVYPQAFAELYDRPDYWLTRFPAWLCHEMGLGTDPFTGDATFPVHTPEGHLAGFGRRRVVEGEGTRYLYPRRWSAASSLFGSGGRTEAEVVLCLVEGAADATAVIEVGCAARAVYGSGVHLPQYELIVRSNPKLILLGFDMDEAGERAVTRAFKDLHRHAPMKRVRWPKKDPADCTPAQRMDALIRAVGLSDYSEDVVPRWLTKSANMKANYERSVEGAA